MDPDGVDAFPIEHGDIPACGLLVYQRGDKKKTKKVKNPRIFEAIIGCTFAFC